MEKTTPIVPKEPRASISSTSPIIATTTFSAVVVTKPQRIMASNEPVILVTGASRGLGHAITNLLLEPPLSANIVAISRSPYPNHASPEQSQLTTIQADVSSTETATATITQTIETYGRLDGIVINHGTLDPVQRISGNGNFEVEIDAWRKSFDTNLFSVVALLKAALPELRKSKGRVIFVSSGAATAGYNGWGAYSAAKAGINSICRTLANEEPDITAIAIRPGVVDTTMQKDIRENQSYKAEMGDAHQRFIDFHKQEKLLKPEQPGKVIANLVVNAPKELSGQYLNWDSEELKEYQ